MLKIDRMRYLRDYQLRIEFNNGVTKDVDLAAELHGEVFAPLKDTSLFKRATVNPETGTVEWPNGADFAPEFLFDIGRAVDQVA